MEDLKNQGESNMILSNHYHWPKHDYYFGIGVTEIVNNIKNGLYLDFKKIKNGDNAKDLCFINLNAYTLVSFFNEVNELVFCSSKIIVIVSTERLLPVAKFFLHEFKNVVSVYDSSCAVEQITLDLKRKLMSIKTTYSIERSEPHLTHKDIILLTMFFTDRLKYYNITGGNKCTSLYRWKTVLANKFGIKKLELLAR